MSYQILALKWRPQKFEDIIGQKHIIKAIAHSFLLKKLHHAYILTGTRGVGKTTIARLFAKGLNCEQAITFDVCRKCKNCQDIESGCFIDLIEIDAASRTKVEDIREFLDNIQYMPSRGRFKIYLIDEVHMLSKYSFNALLKVLEEPPKHVKFILVTTEYKKIPETILSRCLQFYLKPLNINQITKQLTHIFNEENITIEKIALESLAYASQGSMRDALSLAEQAIVLGNNNITSDIINDMFGVVNIEHPLCLITSLIDGNIHDIMNQIDNYSILGVNWDYILTEMLILLQKIAINQFLSCSSQYNMVKDNTTYDINQRMHEISNRITPENIQLYYQILLLGRRELPYAPSYRISIEMTMLRALALKPLIDNNDGLSQNQHKNKDNRISHIANMSYTNDNVTKNLDLDNEIHQTLNQSAKNQTLCSNNNLKQHLHLKHQKCDSDNTVQDISTASSTEITADVTKTLINAHLELSKYRKYNKLNTIKDTTNLIIGSQKKITANILKRFSNINTQIVKNISTSHINNLNTDDSKYLQFSYEKHIDNSYTNYPNIVSTFIKEILQQAMNDDVWISKIYRLSLPKLAKKLIMHSWKEEITVDKICLHLRSNYYHLNSIELKNMIQKSLSEDANKSIILHIKKNDDFLIKTPMEYIHILYMKKISNIKQELLNDPYYQMIKDIFDVKFNESDIEII